MKPGRTQVVILLVGLSSMFFSSVVAVGQDRGARSRGGARAESRAPVVEDDEDELVDDDDDAIGAAESDVVELGGKQVKVFRFSGLDISGRLKSPQLLYFLNRLRAEFDRPRLPHRSFMPELERSAEGKAFR